MGVLHKPAFRALQRFRTVSDEPTLHLDDSRVLGKGRYRICYVHPQDPGKCVKVPTHRTMTKQADQSITEWYMSFGLDRRQVSRKHRPRCHGWARTDHGIGLVMERIHDDDMTPSPSLPAFIAGPANPSPQDIMAMHDEFKTWLFANHVPLMELHAGNILVRQTDGKHHFVLIDGIAGAVIRLKLLAYPWAPGYAWWRTKSRWPRMEQRLLRNIRDDFSRRDKAA